MGSTTKEIIIEAAEQLFATYGFAATSLRQITATAGVNLAAVNYHFRSKAALIDMVLQRMLVPLAEARLHNLERITAEATIPSLEEALRAYYLPFFELLDNRSAVGQRYRQIFGRLANESNEEIRKSVAHYLTPVIEQYFSLLQQIVPHLSPDEFAWRFRAMHEIAATHFVETIIPAPLPGSTNSLSEASEQSFSWAMTYLAAAWRAAATER
ncbi:MAG: TetR/AcrR family transcriptional regulator [Ktedonobacteraceae bacterium]|nr:TetR/AcrR family transcriptional regulator [Ktedonobacteraceae bacterium]